MSDKPTPRLAQRVEDIRIKLRLHHTLSEEDQAWLQACIKQMDREHAHHNINATFTCYGCSLLNTHPEVLVDELPYSPTAYWQLREAIIDIMQERKRQELLGWTEAHDACHDDQAWAGLINGWAGKLAMAALNGDREAARERLVQVAALALAALTARSDA